MSVCMGDLTVFGNRGRSWRRRRPARTLIRPTTECYYRCNRFTNAHGCVAWELSVSRIVVFADSTCGDKDRRMESGCGDKDRWMESGCGDKDRRRGWSRGAEIKTGGWSRGAEIKTGGWSRGAQIKTDGWSRGAEIKTGGWSRGAEIKTSGWSRGAEIKTGGWSRGAEFQRQDRREFRRQRPVGKCRSVVFLFKDCR